MLSLGIVGLICLIGLVLLLLIVHVRILIAALRIELRVRVLLHHMLWVVHLGIRLLLLTLLRGLVSLLIVDHKLEHLELIILHGPHMLHLLMVNTLRLLKHATVIALRLGILDLNHAGLMCRDGLCVYLCQGGRGLVSLLLNLHSRLRRLDRSG